MLASSLGAYWDCDVEGAGSPLRGRGCAAPLRADVVAARRRPGADAAVEGALRRDCAGGGCDSLEELEIAESGRKEREVVLSTRVDRGRDERRVEVRLGAVGRGRVDSAAEVGLRRDCDRDRADFAVVLAADDGMVLGLEVVEPVGVFVLLPSSRASASEFEAISPPSSMPPN